MALFLVCLGGAVGSGARYLIATWAAKTFYGTFPYGTLIVNLIGCFFLGAIMHVAAHSTAITPNARVALTAGVLGGLTTYSSFNYETTELARQGAWQLGLLNFAGTAIGCLAAGLLGLWVAGRIVNG